MRKLLVGPCADARLPAALTGAIDPVDDVAGYHNHFNTKFPKVHFDGGRK